MKQALQSTARPSRESRSHRAYAPAEQLARMRARPRTRVSSAAARHPYLRALRQAGQDFGATADSVPAARRTPFRCEGGQLGAMTGMLSAIASSAPSWPECTVVPAPARDRVAQRTHFGKLHHSFRRPSAGRTSRSSAARRLWPSLSGTAALFQDGSSRGMSEAGECCPGQHSPQQRFLARR